MHVEWENRENKKCYTAANFDDMDIILMSLQAQGAPDSKSCEIMHFG